MDTGLELIEKAIINLNKTEDHEALIQAIARRGACYWWKNQFNETIQAANTILEICETIDDDSQEMLSHRFFARHMIGMSLYAKGDAKATLAYAQETYDRYFSKINAFNRMRMLNMMSYAHLISANYKTCEHYVGLGFEITHALDNAFVNEMLLMILAQAEVIQGHLDEAYIHSIELLQLGEQYNRTHVIIAANSLLGDIFNLLQNYSKALQYYRLAQVRAGITNQTIQRFGNDLQLARLLSLMGQQEEAQEIIQTKLVAARKAGMMQIYSLALSISGFCEILTHDFDEGLGDLQESAEVAVHNGLPYELVWSKVGRCRIALSKRQFDLAEEYIHDVMEESQRLNTAWQKLHGLQLCSQLHHATQRPTLQKYRDMFETLMEELETHTQSDPLRKDFLNAKRLWEEGHHYP
jgi:tetratricopeptide (TPR) repeat protein